MLLSLHKGDFMTVLSKFPAARAIVEKAAQARYRDLMKNEKAQLPGTEKPEKPDLFGKKHAGDVSNPHPSPNPRQSFLRKTL